MDGDPIGFQAGGFPGGVAAFEDAPDHAPDGPVEAPLTARGLDHGGGAGPRIAFLTARTTSAAAYVAAEIHPRMPRFLLMYSTTQLGRWSR